MRIETRSPIWGIEEDVLCWSRTEEKTLLRAADLLARAREAAGEDSALGEDAGKGEVVLRDWADGAVIAHRKTELEG